MINFDDRDDPIIFRAGETAEENETKKSAGDEPTWFEEEGDRQDTPPLEDNL